MAKDISKKIVLVMLVLTIVLSVTGTWLVLDSLEDAGTRQFLIQPQEEDADASSTASVGLTINGKGLEESGPTSEGYGSVRLVIK